MSDPLLLAVIHLAGVCENVTGERLLDCFWSGRSVTAEYGADQACAACVGSLALAHRALDEKHAEGKSNVR